MDQSEKLAVVLRYQGALAAEQELTKIANDEGDEAIARIASNLSAAQVAQVTSEADIVKPSLLHTAVNPEQFRGVFRRVGVRWGAAEQDDCSEETIIEFQEELKQFFCAFILLNDENERRVELLKAILKEPHGLEALAFSVVHEKDFPEFMSSASHATEFGDWREVIGILRTRFSEHWERFVKIAPFANNWKQYNEFVHSTAAEIYAVAVTEGAVERKEQKGSDELFTPYT